MTTLPEFFQRRSDSHGAIILVSGERRIGKTTLLLKVREAAQHAGRSVGGFLSVARFVDGHKTGIDLMNAATGETVALAEYREDTAGAKTPATKHYVFNPDALAYGLRYAESGQAADVFFVDELGPLELERGEGWADVIDMVRARVFGVGFVVVRPELIDVACARLDLPPGAPQITVNADSRDRLAGELAAWIKARPESGS
ncbi:MAG: hypothetical protein GYB65_09285 [Chloroflexi bacterium]|nr:hypothetical protein [Chloroflexota bacterium]